MPSRNSLGTLAGIEKNPYLKKVVYIQEANKIRQIKVINYDYRFDVVIYHKFIRIFCLNIVMT